MEIVNQFNPGTEFLTDEGCYIIELLNDDSDAGCSIARARVKPGITTRLHCLRETIERYVIMEGTGAVEIRDMPLVPVQAMDVVNISAGVSQRITNTGESDLVFLCVCTPRFNLGNYIDLEA